MAGQEVLYMLQAMFGATPQVGYDLDGVLCEAPPPWALLRKSATSEQARAARGSLLRHYRTAAPLLRPEVEHYAVISGRLSTAENRDATLGWLHEYGLDPVSVHLYPRVDLSPAAIGAWKAEIVAQLGLRVYVDDNPAVLERMRSIFAAAGVDTALRLYVPAATPRHLMGGASDVAGA